MAYMMVPVQPNTREASTREPAQRSPVSTENPEVATPGDSLVMGTLERPSIRESDIYGGEQQQPKTHWLPKKGQRVSHTCSALSLDFF